MCTIEMRKPAKFSQPWPRPAAVSARVAEWIAGLIQRNRLAARVCRCGGMHFDDPASHLCTPLKLPMLRFRWSLHISTPLPCPVLPECQHLASMVLPIVAEPLLCHFCAPVLHVPLLQCDVIHFGLRALKY